MYSITRAELIIVRFSLEIISFLVHKSHLVTAPKE